VENYKEIAGLLLKHIRQELSEEERTHLANWAGASALNAAFLDEISNTPALMAEVQAYEAGKLVDLDAAWKKMKALGWEVPVADEPTKKVIPLTWWKYAAAAVIVLFVSIVAFVLLPSRKPSAPAVVQTPVQRDATPKSTHATLTLDNGKTIILDSVTTGLLATEGNTQVVKYSDGVLRYANGKNNNQKLIYNKITVPKGSDVVYLQLSDQTKVWLNAESTIRYPVSFSEEERKVEITGEAYFEVASAGAGDGSGKRSFIVSKGNMHVVVLGTKFNVNTYDNEENIKVTLLEGSVKVQSGPAGQVTEQKIKPGQQAIINKSGIDVNNDVDLQQVMAWKDGKFVFNNTNIQLIMRQVERWYDLEPTRFDNNDVKQWAFNGEVSRYSNASKVLQLLEKTGSVKFRVEGKKIIVTQP
jgi:ferric-dicitrate binding protein FerR (iron transport regulator)